MPEPVIRNISDTARWAAVFRARETEQPDAYFRDPFAARLAGEKGEEIAKKVKFATQHTWSWITRTILADELLERELANGTDMVINLAAGLDARPYRMNLPANLQWVEIDLPEITEYKEEILRDEKPKCKLRRIKIDLADAQARKRVFAELGPQSHRAVIMSEGLLVYLPAEQAGALARDLASQPSFQRWIIDIVSPGLLKMMQKRMGKELVAANAPLVFGPPEGPAFFTKYGWRPLEIKSMLHNAPKNRLPFMMKIFAKFPEPKNGIASPRQPWSGVVLLERT